MQGSIPNGRTDISSSRICRAASPMVGTLLGRGFPENGNRGENFVFVEGARSK